MYVGRVRRSWFESQETLPWNAHLGKIINTLMFLCEIFLKSDGQKIIRVASFFIGLLGTLNLLICSFFVRFFPLGMIKSPAAEEIWNASKNDQQEMYT